MSLRFAGAEPPEQTRAIPVTDASHVGEARRAVVSLGAQLGLDENAAGRVAIVATELATNVANHGGGGHLLARAIAGGTGIELLAIDKGRGIVDVDRAIGDGYSTAGTAGKGLGAVQRMSDVFDIYSQAAQGTVILSRMLRLRPGEVRDKAADKLDVGAVSVAAPKERLCGDGWTIVDGANGPAIIVVDGLGHGDSAHEASALAIEIARRHPGAAPGTLIDLMHRGMRSTRGAAAAVAEMDLAGECLRFAGVGNIACSIVTGEGSKSMASLGGIVGHEVRRVQEFTNVFPPGATLLMYSDGLTTRGRLDQYPGLRPRHPALAAAVMYRDHVRGRDDATVVVARATRT